MQIIINTAEMLGDETTIRAEVIDQVSNSLIASFRGQVANAVSTILDKHVSETAIKVLKEITIAHLDTVITPTNEYGKQQAPYTLRNKLADIIASQCVYKKANYDSAKNAFSIAVDTVVEEELKKFRAEFNSLVTKTLIQSCMKEAQAKLRAACGIK